MANSSRRTLIDVLQAVSTDPKSVNEISREANRNRKAVGNWLNALVEGGLLCSKKFGRSKVYWINPNFTMNTKGGDDE